MFVRGRREKSIGLVIGGSGLLVAVSAGIALQAIDRICRSA